MLQEAGFVDVEISPPVDTFGGAPGEDKVRAYDVRGYAFLAEGCVRISAGQLLLADREIGHPQRPPGRRMRLAWAG